MNDNLNSPFKSLSGAVKTLSACLPLVERLEQQGVNLEVNEDEQALLLNFEKLILANYSESEWSYLRIASGVKIRGIALLTGYLRCFRATAQTGSYGSI